MYRAKLEGNKQEKGTEFAESALKQCREDNVALFLHACMQYLGAYIHTLTCVALGLLHMIHAHSLQIFTQQQQKALFMPSLTLTRPSSL